MPLEKTARLLMNWFSCEDVPLKRLVIGVEPVPGTDKFLFRHWKFAGLRYR